MGNSNNKRKLLIESIDVSECFEMLYASGLSKDAICLYLWLLRAFGNEGGFRISDVLEASQIDEHDTNVAFEELISSDLVFQSRGRFYFTDLKMQEVDEYAREMVARGGVDKDGLELSAEAKQREELASSISKTYYSGSMVYVNYRIIDKCLYEYQFEGMVVYALFENAAENKKLYKWRWIEAKAEEWYKRGYTTMEALDEYLKCEKDAAKAVKLMNRLTRRRANDMDIERIKHWVTDLKVDLDLIEYAFRCNEYRANGISMMNVEETLTAWLKAGVKDVGDASNFEAKKHQENKARYKAAGGARARSKSMPGVTGYEAGITVDTSDVAQGGDVNGVNCGAAIGADIGTGADANAGVGVGAAGTAGEDEANNNLMDDLLTMFGGDMSTSENGGVDG